MRTAILDTTPEKVSEEEQIAALERDIAAELAALRGRLESFSDTAGAWVNTDSGRIDAAIGTVGDTLTGLETAAASALEALDGSGDDDGDTPAPVATGLLEDGFYVNTVPLRIQ